MTEKIATETNVKLTTPTDRELATTRVFDALTIVQEASLFSPPLVLAAFLVWSERKPSPSCFAE
jgi:hypothetical protein